MNVKEGSSRNNVLDDEQGPTKYARVDNGGPAATTETSVLAAKALTIVLQHWLIPDMSWLPTDMESRLTSLKDAIVEDKEKLFCKLQKNEDEINTMKTTLLMEKLTFSTELKDQSYTTLDVTKSFQKEGDFNVYYDQLAVLTIESLMPTTESTVSDFYLPCNLLLSFFFILPLSTFLIFSK